MRRDAARRHEGVGHGEVHLVEDGHRQRFAHAREQQPFGARAWGRRPVVRRSRKAPTVVVQLARHACQALVGGHHDVGQRIAGHVPRAVFAELAIGTTPPSRKCTIHWSTECTFVVSTAHGPAAADHLRHHDRLARAALHVHDAAAKPRCRRRARRRARPLAGSRAAPPASRQGAGADRRRMRRALGRVQRGGVGVPREHVVARDPPPTAGRAVRSVPHGGAPSSASSTPRRRKAARAGYHLDIGRHAAGVRHPPRRTRQPRRRRPAELHVGGLNHDADLEPVRTRATLPDTTPLCERRGDVCPPQRFIRHPLPFGASAVSSTSCWCI